MSKERACANTPALSRRTIVAGAASSALATLPASAAQTDGHTDPESNAAVLERLLAFAEITETTPPPLEHDDRGNIEASEALVAYCFREGMSLDWLFIGDIRGLVLSYRKAQKAGKEFRSVLSQLSERQTDGFNFALRAHLDQGVPLATALAELKQVL